MNQRLYSSSDDGKSLRSSFGMNMRLIAEDYLGEYTVSMSCDWAEEARAYDESFDSCRAVIVDR